MAIIKCEYIKTYCGYWGKYDRKEVFHDDLWFCDTVHDNCIGKYERPIDADKKLVNPVCKHCIYETVRFEKNYKQFELSVDQNKYPHDGYLRIGKKIIDLSMANYLEIDGKIYINDEDEAE